MIRPNPGSLLLQDGRGSVLLDSGAVISMLYCKNTHHKKTMSPGTGPHRFFPFHPKQKKSLKKLSEISVLLLFPTLKEFLIFSLLFSADNILYICFVSFFLFVVQLSPGSGKAEAEAGIAEITAAVAADSA